MDSTEEQAIDLIKAYKYISNLDECKKSYNFANILRKYRIAISDIIVIDEIFLRSCGTLNVLTESLIEQVESISNNKDKIYFILDIFNMRPNSFIKFITILMYNECIIAVRYISPQIGKLYVDYKYQCGIKLTLEEKVFLECDDIETLKISNPKQFIFDIFDMFDNSECKCKFDNYMTQHQAIFVSSIDVNMDLLEYLSAIFILTTSMVEIILSIPTNKGKANKLLNILPCRGPKALYGLILSLYATNQNDLAKKIDPFNISFIIPD